MLDFIASTPGVYWVWLVFHLLVMPVAAFHALVYKRDHRAALGWIGVIVIAPVVGPLIYFFFGINRLRSRARLFTGRYLPFMHFGFERASLSAPADFQDPLAGAQDNPALAMVGGRVTGTKLISGNELRMLANGETFFPRLLAEIERAQTHILVSSYLFSSRGIARDVIDCLSQAVERGVRVYVLIDGVGVLYSLRRALRPLRKADVEVALFMPPRLLPPSISINLRNHRKIVVVDGKVAFFGGINIDQRHMVEDPANSHPTEDIQFEARGPVVASLQNLFAEDWWLATHENLVLPDPPENMTGRTACRVINDGPDESLDHLAMTLNGVFASARYEIAIMMPYFLPNREMLAVLQTATLRGVRVRIILPERSNLRILDWATRNMLWELLIWNVDIYYKPPPFAHSKLIVVDDHYVLGGSANLDPRSLRLNFELGVEMFDRELAARVTAHMDTVMAESRPVELAELDNRPLTARARDALCWLFSSYL